MSAPDHPTPATLAQCVAIYDHELRARARRLMLYRQESDVDDVMQETWMRAQRFWEGCRGQRRAWLHSILHSVACTYLRKMRRHGRTFVHAWKNDNDEVPRSGAGGFDELIDDASLDAVAAVSTPADDAEATELREHVNEAVAELSERDQDLLVGHYLEDRPIKELADEIALDEPTARTALFRARGTLRENLRDDLRSAAAARWARGLPG